VNLTKWRKEKGLTQGELAEKIQVNPKTYQAYETDRAAIPPEVQKRIRKLGYVGPWPEEEGGQATRDDLKALESLMTEKFGAVREDLRGVGAALHRVLDRLQQLEENAPARKP
jgi:transcriptional regulator with XRE-family HTH domain